MIIKVCGLTDTDNIGRVVALRVDWIGMVFCPSSPRFIQMASTRAGIIPDRALHNAPVMNNVKRAGVFVDDMPQNIITRTVNYQLDIIQLHGHETPTLIRNLRSTIDTDIHPGIQFVKAFSISSADDFSKCQDYEGVADYFLFDTRSPQRGGSGKKFDWNVLGAYRGKTPFLLSGGIGPEDADRIKALHYPQMAGIDLNSRFETSPGIKDIEKLKTFIKAVRA